MAILRELPSEQSERSENITSYRRPPGGNTKPSLFFLSFFKVFAEAIFHIQTVEAIRFNNTVGGSFQSNAI